MAGLQRSVQTFRRSGSSGLVWDERFLTEDAEATATDNGAEAPRPELRHSRSVGSIGMLRRSGDGDRKRAKHKKSEEEEGGKKAFQTKDVAPALDPPSPRVAGCILCAIFRSSSGGRRRRAKPRRQ